MKNSTKFISYDKKFEIENTEFYERLDLSESDVVCICGTLVAGIGNHHSDFDVYVFSEKRPNIKIKHLDKHDWVSDDSWSWITRSNFLENTKLRGTWDFWDKYERSLDVKYWENNEFHKYCIEFNNKYIASTQNLGYVLHNDYLTYGIGDSALFSKLFTGKTIQREDKFKELLGPFNKDKYCYMAYRYHTPVYDWYRDIAGAFKSQDYDNGVLFTKLYCEYVAWSFSHLLLDANTNKKWIAAMVKNWPEEYSDVKNKYISSLFLPLISIDEKREYILDMLDWSDKIFELSVPILKSNPYFTDPDLVDQHWKRTLIDKPGGKKTSFQTEEEYQWYRRLATTQAIPLKELLLKSSRS